MQNEYTDVNSQVQVYILKQVAPGQPHSDFLKKYEKFLYNPVTNIIDKAVEIASNTLLQADADDINNLLFPLVSDGYPPFFLTPVITTSGGRYVNFNSDLHR